MRLTKYHSRELTSPGHRSLRRGPGWTGSRPARGGPLDRRLRGRVRLFACRDGGFPLGQRDTPARSSPSGISSRRAPASRPRRPRRSRRRPAIGPGPRARAAARRAPARRRRSRRPRPRRPRGRCGARRRLRGRSHVARAVRASTGRSPRLARVTSQPVSSSRRATTRPVLPVPPRRNAFRATGSA